MTKKDFLKMYKDDSVKMFSVKIDNVDGIYAVDKKDIVDVESRCAIVYFMYSFRDVPFKNIFAY